MTKTMISLIALATAIPAFAQTDSDQATDAKPGDEIVVTASRSGEGIKLSDLPPRRP